MSEPFAAFPSWFLKITCDRCGKVTWLNEAHTSDRRRRMALSLFLARMRHEGCGGLPGKAELVTGIDGASSGPVRRIVLGWADPARLASTMVIRTSRWVICLSANGGQKRTLGREVRDVVARTRTARWWRRMPSHLYHHSIKSGLSLAQGPLGLHVLLIPVQRSSVML
jgi:hypothetical protein